MNMFIASLLITAKTFWGLTTFATFTAGMENAAPPTYVLVHGAWSSSGGLNK